MLLQISSGAKQGMCPQSWYRLPPTPKEDIQGQREMFPHHPVSSERPRWDGGAEYHHTEAKAGSEGTANKSIRRKAVFPKNFRVPLYHSHLSPEAAKRGSGTTIQNNRCKDS